MHGRCYTTDMHSLLIVGKELWYFVFVERFGFSRPKPLTLKLPSATATKIPLASTSVKTLPIQGGVQASSTSELTGAVLYVAVPATPLQLYPTTELDGVLKILPYASRVSFRRRQGRWVEVSYLDTVGWVEEGVLVLEERAVKPQFTSGSIYTATNDETIKLRTYIQDEFHTVVAELPLQNIEYVYYRLLEMGRVIAWPETRPRIAGVWQQILKGQPGIHIGVEPKTHSVLETFNGDGFGQVQFVEAVLPDKTLTIRQVRYDEPGLFEESIVHEEVWREWRPIFIEVM